MAFWGIFLPDDPQYKEQPLAMFARMFTLNTLIAALYPGGEYDAMHSTYTSVTGTRIEIRRVAVAMNQVEGVK